MSGKKIKKLESPPPSLGGLDMKARLDGDDDYEARLSALQTTLVQIQQAYLGSQQSAVVVFEGWDAAGKGGAIRRMSHVLDPRGFKVWPIAAPTEEDLKRHYLARFWTRLPEKGGIAVFDRSWYGRVLVERVESLATAEEWGRAYGEIAAFEKTLVDSGARIVKIFLAISREEQLRRFIARMDDPLKRWKLSVEDFRNRGRWEAYVEAAEEMLAKTSVPDAPWCVVAANQKKYARITALQEICVRLSRGVDLTPRPLDPKVRAEGEKLRAALGTANSTA